MKDCRAKVRTLEWDRDQWGGITRQNPEGHSRDKCKLPPSQT